MNATTDNDIEKWYVIATRTVRQEEKIRDELIEAGFRSHVPMRYDTRRVRGQEQRTMVPAIAGLIFARGSYNDLRTYIDEKAKIRFSLRKSTFSNKQDYLTVRDSVMERFIEFTNIRQENIVYFKPDELDLKAGETIRIKGGFYDGKEATIMRIKGKRNKHYVVQIPGVLAAAIEIKPDMVEIDKPIRELPSKDVDGDKRLLLETAEWLLANKPEKDVASMTYNLNLVELKRTRARLMKNKGFTPITEAELALPMYLAARILQEDVEACRARLELAASKLKDCCKLKAKCLAALNK